MNSKQFKKYRLLFVRDSCPYCRMYYSFIEKINSKLQISKRIKVINCSNLKYGIVDNQLISLFDKQVQGYPTLIIDGIKIDGINSAIETRAFLESYLNSEFVVPEENNNMFIKECNFVKSKIFGRHVVCND